MSLATEMIRQSSIDRIIGTLKGADGKWNAYESVNHPTPSGCDRWLITYSDNRGWDDEETAKKEFEYLLVPLVSKTNV
jgi:hypothetical protein